MLKARPFVYIVVLTFIGFIVVLTIITVKQEASSEQLERKANIGMAGDTTALVEQATIDSDNVVDELVIVSTEQLTYDSNSELNEVTPALPKQATRHPGGSEDRVTPRENADQRELSPTKLNQSANSLPVDGQHLPLMIRWSNWLPEFGPALVYAKERDLDGMLGMQGPVDKMLMVTSYTELERLMLRADELHATGVTIVGFNTENGPEMTPHTEMETLDSPDPNINIVARAARLATQHGFEILWGPVRVTADKVSDASIRTMVNAGVSGLALQEQKFIEVQPAQERLDEVNRTRERYLQLAQDESVNNFAFHVQIMPQRCPDLNNCVTFVLGLEGIPVDSIAIWSNGPIPLSFIAAIRHY